MSGNLMRMRASRLRPIFQSVTFIGVLTLLSLGNDGAHRDATAATKTYYVDYATGSDNNNGTSTSNPFKHAPGDSSCAAACATVALAPGDTIVFKGGIVYRGSGSGSLISIPRSGATNSYITYRGNTPSGNWGVGRAKIDLGSIYHSAFAGSSKSYIQVLNFEIYHLKNPTNSAAAKAGTCSAGQFLVTRAGEDQCVTYSGNGITGAVRVTGQSSNWIVSRNIVHTAQNYDDWCVVGAEASKDPSKTFAVPAQTVAFNFTGPGVSDVIISDNECYAIGLECVNLYGTTNVTVSRNNIGGINRGKLTGHFGLAMRISGSSGTPTSGNDNIDIVGNVIHDGWQYEGDEASARCHSGDWIHIYSGTTRQGTITIRNNFFYNDKIFNFSQGTAVSLIQHNVRTLNIWNNVIVNPHAPLGGIVIGETVSETISYENNTVVVFNTNSIAYALVLSNPAGVTFRNNVCVQYGTSKASCVYNGAGKALPSISDYNVFFTPNGAQAVRYGSNNYSLQQWQLFSGRDAHTVSTDPILASVPPSGLVSSKGNYRPGPRSQAKDTGVAIELFDYDITNTLRPQGRAWDRGAYEIRQ